jgi:hypothetical protein
MAVDRKHGVVGADATLISFVGKTLEGFKIAIKNGSAEAVDMSNEVGDGSNILGNERPPYGMEPILQTVLTKASILMYKMDAANGLVTVIVENEDAWTTSTLQSALQALSTVTSVDGSTAIDVSGTTVSSADLDV